MGHHDTLDHKNPGPAELHRLYHGEGLSLPGVAAALGVCFSTARKWLLAAGIERRSSGPKPMADAPPGAAGRSPAPRRTDDRHPGADELARLYRDEGLSIRELAERAHVSQSTARKWLVEAGIRRRVAGAPARPGGEG